jgi:hypothetical protein
MGTAFRLIPAALLAAAVCAGTAACGDSPRPTATVYGDFVLSSSWAYRDDKGQLIRPAELASDANTFGWTCTGIGTFQDVTENAVVTLLDGSGASIATGKVAGSQETLGPDNKSRCTLHWTIDKAPKHVSGAQVRVGQHPASALNSDYDEGYATVNLVQ